MKLSFAQLKSIVATYVAENKISVDSFEDNDGDMAITGSLLGVSDIVEGKFNISTKAFTKGLEE